MSAASLTREQETATDVVFETPGLSSQDRALAVVAVVYGAQARRWVLYRARNGYSPGWSGSWPEDLGIALDWYADRVTEPWRRQLRGQWREKPGVALKNLEAEMYFSRLILMANARAHLEVE